MEKGYALTVARYLDDDEHLLPQPSIRLIVTTMLSKDEMTQVAEMLNDAFESQSIY